MFSKILRLIREKRLARSKDIAARLRQGSFRIGIRTKMSLSSVEFSAQSPILIGDECNIRARLVCRLGESSIKVGNHCFLGSGTVLLAAKQIQIGDHVLIGGNCYITDNDGHALDPELRVNDVSDSVLGRKNWVHVGMGAVLIGDHVWIAPNCIILKGVTIGRGAVIAAGSVVTRDIPEMMLAAGNPARPIKPVTTKPTSPEE